MGTPGKQTTIAYTREQLLVYKDRVVAPPRDLPKEIRRHRRGTRAGAREKDKREKNRRRYKPYLPSVVMGNVRSIVNKTDELSALVSSQWEYREASLLCFTETWLNGNIPDWIVDADGFTVVRADRDKQSGKRKGGGLAVYVNKRWCNPGHITVKERICTPDVELLAVGLRPSSMPREFSHAIVVTVYVPPSAVAAQASDVIHASVASLQTAHPSAFIIVNGDFNHVSMSKILTNFTQYVTCNTRGDRTLDLLYANVKDAYSSTALPPLGASDHNLIRLATTYRPLIRRQPATTRTVQLWSEEVEEELRDCFRTTDWSLFERDFGEDIDGLSQCVTGYINFCEESIVPTRRSRCYPNDKPWINGTMKALLRRKKRVFRNIEERRAVGREAKKALSAAKEGYRDRLEGNLQADSSREVWRGMRTITGYKQPGTVVEGTPERANELNRFFNRFDLPTSSDVQPGSSPPPTSSDEQPGSLPPPHTPPPSSTPPSSLPPPLLPSTPFLLPSTHGRNFCPPPAPLTPSPPPPPPGTSPQPTSPPPPPPGASPSPPPRPISPPPPPPGLPSPSTSPPPPPPPPPLNTSPTPPHTTPAPLIITTRQVRKQLSKVSVRKARGPDNINPRVLKACAGQLAVAFQHLFNLSLRLEEVPKLWKTSCIVPVPKKARPSALNDYRPVALTSHVMKIFERLVLQHLKPLVSDSLDPLQFAYQANIGVDDAIIYMLHRAYTHLERPRSTVRVMFFDFSSAFNTIQPRRLAEKLSVMQVDHGLVAWITDYLTRRPQYVRLQSGLSDVLVSNTGAPQGTVLSPFLFTLYTSDFRYNSGTCHLQKFSDDSSIVSCITDDNDGEYRALVESFVGWCDNNHLQLNIGKTKELVVDYRRSTRKPPTPIIIRGEGVEMVDNYKFLGVHMNNKLDWTDNSEALYRKGQSKLFFLRRLRSFNVCSRLLHSFYQSVVASVLFFAVVCWGGGINTRDANKLNKLVKKASSVVGVKLVNLETVMEGRMLRKLDAILMNPSHPLYGELVGMRSTFSHRLIPPRHTTKRLGQSFVPVAIRLHNQA